MNKLKVYFLIVLGISFFSLDAQEGLVGYWSFNDLIGDVFHDHSQFQNHGENFGGELVNGVFGSALQFDGKTDFASILDSSGNAPPVFHDLGEGSISLWFKVEHIPEDNGIAPIFYYGTSELCNFFDAANKGLILEVGHSPVHYRSERLYFTIWKNGCTLPSFCYDSNHGIETGKWYHLVVVVGENYNTGYLNGSEMLDRRYNFGNSSYSQFFADAVEHQRLWLGKGQWDGSPQFYKGAVDELRIYNRPLSTTEVQGLYEENYAGPTSLPANRVKSEDLIISPVPVNDIISYELNHEMATIKGIKIFDMKGSTIKEVLTSSKSGNLNVNQLQSGIYNIVFTGDGFRLHEKIIIK